MIDENWEGIFVFPYKEKKMSDLKGASSIFGGYTKGPLTERIYIFF